MARGDKQKLQHSIAFIIHSFIHSFIHCHTTGIDARVCASVHVRVWRNLLLTIYCSTMDGMFLARLDKNAHLIFIRILYCSSIS